MPTLPVSLTRPSVVAGMAGIALLGAFIGRQATATPAVVLVGVVALLVIPLIASNLTIGVIVLTALGFFELVPWFGAGSLSLIKVVGLLVAISWLVLTVDRYADIPLLFEDFRLFSAGLALFVGLAVVSAAWADDSSRAVEQSLRLVLAAMLVFITYSAIANAKHLRWLIWTYCTAAFASTAYGLAKGLAVGSVDRLVGGILNPNQLAAALVPAIILGCFLLPATRSTLWRLVLVVEIGTSVVGLLLTQSRGGFVGFAVGLAAALVLAGRARIVVAAVVLVIASVGVTYYAGFTTVQQKQRLTSVSAEGSSGRSDEWTIAWLMAKDHPGLGVGYENYREHVDEYVTRDFNILDLSAVFNWPPPHNTYLQVLSELGVVGMALFAAVVGGALALGIRGVQALARGPDLQAELIARGVVVAFIAFLALAVFHNGLAEKSLWLFLGLLMVIARLGRDAVGGQEDLAGGVPLTAEND